MKHEAYLDMAQSEEAHWWFRGRRANLAAVIAGLNLPANPRILEIGSGTGGNFAMLQKFGRLTAVEMSETARALSLAKAGSVNVLEGWLADGMPDLPEKFDMICLFDVLEHVREDVAALQVVRRYLTPGGVVVITVPAFKKLWGPHDEALHHQRRYEKAELGAKLRQTGYAVQKLSYSNMFLFPAAVAMRLADRLAQLILKRSQAGGTGVLPQMLNEGFATIFAAERFLIGRMNLPIGLSLLAVARSGA